MIDTAPLIAEITAAFDGVAREDGVSLRESRVIDDYGCDEERAEARLLDTDTRWQDVSDADMQEYDGVLTFSDAKGFRYYLPAYMLRDLRLYVHPTYGFSSDTLSGLQISSIPGMRDYKLEQFALITPPQGRAVCSFLEFIVAHGDEYYRQDAADALTAYWNQYCEGDAE